MPRAEQEVKKEKLVQQLPRAKREARKESQVHQLTRAKREAGKESQVHQLTRAKREAKKGNWSTNCLERSERLRRETGPQIASSEARS